MSIIIGRKPGGAGGGGGAPSGPAGGDLGGTYPNPTVTSVEADAVDTAGLQDESVTAAKVDSGVAIDGQVLTADGSGGAAWEAPIGIPPFLGILGSASVAIGNTDVYIFKCWVPTDFIVNSIAFRVVSQNGNMQVGIYSSAGAEMYDSGSFAVPAVGARAHTTSVPVVLTPGWVYVAIQTSGTAQFAITSAGIGVGSSFANTYANGLPANLPALTALTTPVCLTLHP